MQFTMGVFEFTSWVFFSLQTVKKEEGEHSAPKKPKKTKEEIEEARQLKIKKKEEEEQNRWRWLVNVALFILHRPSPNPSTRTHNQKQTARGKQSSNFHLFILLPRVRWEEEKYEDGVKWKFLEHNGPYFPPEYQPLPDNVNFYYGGQLNVRKGQMKKGERVLHAFFLTHYVYSQLLLKIYQFLPFIFFLYLYFDILFCFG